MALCGNRGQSCDFVSRGMDSLKLKTCELWWNGPKFLMSNQYPQRQIPVAVIKDPALRVSNESGNLLTPSSKGVKTSELSNKDSPQCEPSPELESRPYGTAVSVTNLYTGWAARQGTQCFE
ncbi:hypothetical protein TNCV_3476471 [Trichonephila clavipes]|nr:hypothetical protein TNCV_3476471 [Trichonephila clavipes]